jgi:AMMECR1 domain-containing protein
MVEPTQEQTIDMKSLTTHCFDSLMAGLKKIDLPAYPSHLEDPEYPIFVTWTMGKDDDLRGCIGTFSG